MADYQPQVLWSLRDSAVRTASGDTICRLEPAVVEPYGKLLTAAPMLASALRACADALERAALYIPPDSDSDVAAAGAITLAYRALEAAGENWEEKECLY